MLMLNQIYCELVHETVNIYYPKEAAWRRYNFSIDNKICCCNGNTTLTQLVQRSTAMQILYFNVLCTLITFNIEADNDDGWKLSWIATVCQKIVFREPWKETQCIIRSEY
jgi:hypothetical protein